MSIGGIGASSGRTTSTVSNVSQVWVRTDDDREVAVRTNPDKFATRDGHRVSMLVAARNSGPSLMVAGVNHSTGDRRREAGFPMILLAIMSMLFLSWIPVLFFFSIHPLIGLVTGGLFVWMVVNSFVRGCKIIVAGSAFLIKAGSTASRVSNIGAEAFKPI